MLHLKRQLASSSDGSTASPARTVLVLDMHSLGLRHRDGTFLGWLKSVLRLNQAVLPYTFEHVSLTR